VTTTITEYTINLVVTLPDAQTVAELATIAILIVTLLEREMVRNRPQLWSQAATGGLVALTIPLGIAWAVIIIQRFLDLLQ
jgi:hypothetical protein